MSGRILSRALPSRDEREHLGRFYWASFASELMNVILPFQFVYLLLVLDEPSWAPIPPMIEGFVIFCMEIPTGVIADRFGRKVSSLLGDVMSAIGWVLVPLTTVTGGMTQLGIACLAFALEGLGQTMVSGAEQAWVMDNLIARGKPGLINQYFARVKSVSSFGGIVSGIAVWSALLLMTVNASLINAFWYLSAIGQLVSVAILFGVPEHSLPEGARDEDDGELLASGPSGSRARAAFKTIWSVRPLLALFAVALIVAFSHSVVDDGFQMAMIFRDLNPRNLAPLTIANDVIGFVAPLFLLGLVRRFGAPHVMITILVAAACFYTAFFFSPPLAVVVALYLLTNLLRDMWLPVSSALLQSYLPSSSRATIGSIINQFSELAITGGHLIFVLMLGKHAEELQASIPDLVDAFAGVKPERLEVPSSVFGLPVYDAALVLFTFAGLAAAVILWICPWQRPVPSVLEGEDEDEDGDRLAEPGGNTSEKAR